MKRKSQPFYGYINEDHPIVLESEPEGFDNLPGSYFLICPNLAIAELAYKAALRIKKWQSPDKRRKTK